ncbi:transposase, partial [Mycobacterium sp. E3198]|uniref:transposase n=1 Tax=Mycobacterium sp. E3198 TaxID=1834143 RepID=UPI000B1207F8
KSEQGRGDEAYSLSDALGQGVDSLGESSDVGQLLASQLSDQPGHRGQPVTETIDTLAQRIGQRVRLVAPALLALPGCAELTAAKLVGETAGAIRFKSAAAYARHAGVAPVPVWSGNTAGRVRMTRSGNRQLNAALHRIAVTQIRLEGLGQVYYRRRIAAGDSKTEALRCLKRRLARIVFGHLQTDEQTRQKPCQPAAA